MHQEKATLQRQLKPMHVWAVAFGCIVGWGSFINPGKKFLPNSGVAGTAIAMALGALVMIIIAFSYAYMVPKYPQAGGECTFTKMCFGKRAAYVCGWFLVAAYLTNVPMNSTAIGLIVDGLDGSADILKFGFCRRWPTRTSRWIFRPRPPCSSTGRAGACSMPRTSTRSSIPRASRRSQRRCSCSRRLSAATCALTKRSRSPPPPSPGRIPTALPPASRQ